MDNLERKDGPQDLPFRKKILLKAAELIVGQRQKDYGTPEKNFQRIADLWTIHIEKILLPGAKLSPRQVAEMMVLLKLARTIESPTEDSYVDAAGYAGIAGELADNEEQLRKETEIKKSNIITGAKFYPGGPDSEFIEAKINSPIERSNKKSWWFQ